MAKLAGYSPSLQNIMRCRLCVSFGFYSFGNESILASHPDRERKCDLGSGYGYDDGLGRGLKQLRRRSYYNTIIAFGVSGIIKNP